MILMAPIDEICVALDIETTGLSSQRDEVIEVAAVKFQGSRVLDTFQSLLNPDRPVPPEITALTGLADGNLRDAPSFNLVAAKLEQFVGSCPLLGQNLPFDLGFLRHRGLSFAGASYDTKELADILLPGLLSHSLASLAKHFDVPHPRPHRALPDAQVTHEVFIKLLERAMALETPVLEELHRLCSLFSVPLGHLLQVILAKKVQRSLPSGAAIGIEGFSLQRLRSLVEGEALAPQAKTRPMDMDRVVNFFKPSGALAQAIPDFDHRPQQERMGLAIAEAFNEGGQLLVEAGTGVGKSMAYLLPALYYGLQNGRRAVISTNTLSLQEQLVNHDIPLLASTLRGDPSLPLKELKVATLKGRANYLCLSRWLNLRAQGPRTPSEASFLTKTLVWLQETATGDRAELALSAEEATLWAKVSADSTQCSPERCSYHRQRVCFLAIARTKAQQAHLLVVNHALLLSDLVRKAGVLPDYQHLIIDEAHHLEDEATRQLGFQIRDTDMSQLFDSLLSRSPSARPAGLLDLMPMSLAASGLAQPARERAEKAIGNARRAIESAGERWQILMSALQGFVRQHTQDAGEYELQLTINSGVRTQPDWADIEVKAENAIVSLDEVSQALVELLTHLQESIQAKSPLQDSLLSEGLAAVESLEHRKEQLQEILFRPQKDYVYWCSLSPKDGLLSFNVAPLDVGQFLREQLFDPRDTIVLTSATLAAGGSFDYTARRLGIESSEKLKLDTPFDYRRSALLFVARDVPEPADSRYQDLTSQALIELCGATRGRALLLFTSYASLNATYQAIRRPLERMGVKVMAQGVEASPRQMISAFSQDPQCVLLGTSSFWEGIDLPGNSLKVLVLARLPFAVPTDPLFAARAQEFDDPFNQYALPQAALRFRQGFGRLIRHQRDRGAVVILDSRILSRYYGRVFLESIPPCTQKVESLQALKREVLSWIEQQGS